MKKNLGFLRRCAAMARLYASAALAVTLLAACDGWLEPSYGGLTAIAFNYTPLNIDDVRVKDAYGNSAYAGGGPPGSGEGSFSCCWKLKGREMTIEWTTYVRGNSDNPEKRTAKATIPEDDSGKYLNVHIYPDDHVELEINNKMLGGGRINFYEIDRLLMKKPEMQGKDPLKFMFISAVSIGDAWKKYGLTDTDDLASYAYLQLFIHPDFDKEPDFLELLQTNKGSPGGFFAAVESMPQSRLQKLKSDGNSFVRLGPLAPEREKRSTHKTSLPN